MATLVEITFRRFFVADEGEVVPALTVTADPEKLTVGDRERLIGVLSRQVDTQLANAPFTNLREMTPDEVQAYRAAEAADLDEE